MREFELLFKLGSFPGKTLSRNQIYIIYGIINLMLISGIIGVGAIVNNRGNRPNLMRTTLEAFEKIAQGDFEVFIEQDEHRYYKILTDSINKMTKDLGSMEQLRQDFISNISHEFQSVVNMHEGSVIVESAWERERHLK